DFPVSSGIVLTTGVVSDVPGPFSSITSPPGGGWPDDPQLSTYSNNALGVNDTYNDATILEFDFLPLSSNVSFNYVFASYEYGDFQCNYSDPFAFFLTDNVTGQVINMALVPGTNDIVSVLTIRDNTYNPNCPSVNPTYFDKYYGTGVSIPP